MNVPKWTNATFQPDCPPSGTTLADGYMPCTPCGIQSLDQYLDGFTNSTSMGLSMGSLCLIVDDSQAHRSFASVIERCFVAEGLCSDQSVAIILNNNRESEFRSSIPAPNENMEPKEETDKSVKLDIAWRYERYDANRILCQSLSTAHGRQFRLNKKLDTRENRMRFFKLNLLYANRLDVLYRQLKDYLEEEFAVKNRVIRVLFQSFGSPLWSCDNSEAVLFLYKLKKVIRDRPCVFLITIPSSIDRTTLSKFVIVADYALKLVPLRNNEELKDINGFIQILKMESICASMAPIPTCGRNRGSEICYSITHSSAIVSEFNPPSEPDHSPRLCS